MWDIFYLLQRNSYFSTNEKEIPTIVLEWLTWKLYESKGSVQYWSENVLIERERAFHAPCLHPSL